MIMASGLLMMFSVLTIYNIRNKEYKWLSIYFLLIYSTIISFTKYVSPSLNYIVYLVTLIMLLKTFNCKIFNNLISFWYFIPFLVSVFLSLVTAIDINRSQHFIIIFITGIMWIMLFGSIVKKEEKNLERISLASSTLLYLCIAFSLWDYFHYESFIEFIEEAFQPSTIQGYYLFHSFDRVIGIGLYPGINAAMIALLYLISSPSLKKHKFVNILTISAVTWAITMSGNRGVLLLWILSLILLYFELIIKLSLQKKLIMLLYSFLTVVLLLLINSISDFKSEKFTGLNRLISNENNISINSRFSIYEEALSIWSDNKVIGIGIDNFVSYAEARGGVGILNEVTHVHNIYIQVLVETGIIGLFCFFVIIFNFIFVDVKLINKLGFKGNHISFLLASYVFLLNGLSANPLYNSQLLLLFLLIRGVLFGISQTANKP
jgi:O-antigen ligase